MLTSHLLKTKLEWKRRSHMCWLYAFFPSTAEALRPILGPMLSTKDTFSVRMLVSGACLKNLQQQAILSTPLKPADSADVDSNTSHAAAVPRQD